MKRIDSVKLIIFFLFEGKEGAIALWTFALVMAAENGSLLGGRGKKKS